MKTILIVICFCAAAFAQPSGGGVYPPPNKPSCTATRTTNCAVNADSSGAVSVGATVVGQDGITVGGLSLQAYQEIIKYKPQAPNNGPIPTLDLLARYDLTNLAPETTSVANLKIGGPALTLVGAPTLGTCVGFSGGTQYGVSASALTGITLGGRWTIILALNQTGTSASKGAFGLGGNADATHYATYYSSSGGNATVSVGGATSRNGGTINDTGTLYSAPTGAYSAIMLHSNEANVYFTRLDTGGWGFTANAGGTTVPFLGIGVDIRNSAFNITDSMTACYAFAWNRTLDTGEVSAVYGWLSDYLGSKGIAMKQYKRPALVRTNLPDNGLQRAPTMGWSSWYIYAGGENMTDANMRLQAAALVSTGLAAKGYNYFNIDGGWSSLDRDDYGNIQPNSKFPDMAALGAYVHGLGLKYGLYTSAGRFTCDGTLGSYLHESQDAMKFASWGADFLKHDWCTTTGAEPYNEDPEFWQSATIPVAGAGMPLAAYQNRFEATFGLMGAALRMTGRPIVYNIASGPLGPSYTPWTWGEAAGGNSWRVGSDIADGWAGVDEAFDATTGSVYANPGHFNDPDNLNTRGGLTDTEFQTQMSLWSILAAPLVLGQDLLTITAEQIAIAGNVDVITVDQDPLALQGVKASSVACGSATCEVWARKITGTNTCAVGLFNRASTAQDITATFSDIATAIPACSGGPWTVTKDLWTGASIGTLTTSYTAIAVPSHGVKFIRVAP